MTTEEKNARIASIKNEIENYLSLGDTQMIFDFSTKDEEITLNVITANPRHNQSFLFHSTTGFSQIDALQQMLEYVKEHREKKNSYTIQWAVTGENELHTSYFRAKDIPAAIDKLYFDRDPNSINIFSIVLNPIS